MSFIATVVNVMIASPGDVAAERQTIRSVIHDWNVLHAEERQLVLLPLGWETHASPLMGDRAQSIINQQVLHRCDLLIAVFWTRLGSPTGEAPSGTVEEINNHLAAGKPAMLYFSNAPVMPDSVDPDQYRALRQFRKESEPRGLVESYASLDEFREKIVRQLTQTVQRYFKGFTPLTEGEVLELSTPPLVPALSGEARRLLVEVARDKHGSFLCGHTMHGMHLVANGMNLAEGTDDRGEARWQAAVEELVTLGLAEPQGYKGEVFRLTNAGYEAADRLNQQGA